MAAERLRRNRALDPDGQLRALCVVIYTGPRRGEHLPPRNLVSTLFELNGAGATAAAVAAPLEALGEWLPELGDRAEGALAACAEWLTTRMPDVFPAAETRELVERLASGRKEDSEMAYTVMEEQIERRARRAVRGREAELEAKGMVRGMERGMERGQRDLLRGMAARKFGADTAARLAALLEDIRDPARLADAGHWMMDSATGDELIARFGNGSPGR